MKSIKSVSRKLLACLFCVLMPSFGLTAEDWFKSSLYLYGTEWNFESWGPSYTAEAEYGFVGPFSAFAQAGFVFDPRGCVIRASLGSRAYINQDGTAAYIGIYPMYRSDVYTPLGCLSGEYNIAVELGGDLQFFGPFGCGFFVNISRIGVDWINWDFGYMGINVGLRFFALMNGKLPFWK